MTRTVAASVLGVPSSGDRRKEDSEADAGVTSAALRQGGDQFDNKPTYSRVYYQFG